MAARVPGLHPLVGMRMLLAVNLLVVRGSYGGMRTQLTHLPPRLEVMPGWEDVARSVVSLGALICPAFRLQMVSLCFPQQ